jgi:hypothetical protein
VDNNFEYKGFNVTASARQINVAPNEAWRPLYRINGTDRSQAWTPRDRSIVYATEKTAISEAGKRAEWLIDNSAATLVEQQ